MSRSHLEDQVWGVVSRRQAEAGMSLIVVLLILVVVSILGVAGIQISMMGERSTRNDRDKQVAWQSAEAALIDAELDILGKPDASTVTKRGEVFKRGSTDVGKFLPGCGGDRDAKNLGLCYSPSGAAPAWLTVDLAASTNPQSVAFGTFTGRAFPSGQAGLQPAAPPRYVIELVEDPTDARTTAPKDRKYIYRVTAMGFGPSASTQGVLQIVYRN
ncbi:pilus assembly protein [Paracidovorax citrulli]|nr:pilus assembly protein [Paracidovorax citrulli]